MLQAALLLCVGFGVAFCQHLALALRFWSSADLAWLQELAALLLERFQDRDQGGFFFTADDQESLIQRSKPLSDEAIPSGNGVAALALIVFGLEGLIIQNLFVKLVVYLISPVPILGIAWITSRKV